MLKEEKPEEQNLSRGWHERNHGRSYAQRDRSRKLLQTSFRSTREKEGSIEIIIQHLLTYKLGFTRVKMSPRNLLFNTKKLLNSRKRNIQVPLRVMLFRSIHISTFYEPVLSVTYVNIFFGHIYLELCNLPSPRNATANTHAHSSVLHS